jgi:hypothetical protein
LRIWSGILLYVFTNFLLLGDPADYDELVSEDAGIDAGIDAGSVSMEDANSVLNANDDDMDMVSAFKNAEPTARMEGKSKPSSGGVNQSIQSIRD